MNRITKAVASVVEYVMYGGAKTATKYIGERFVVKATRKGKLDGRHTQQHIVLTVGTPNYAERKFIKDCLKAGETFPVRRVQIKLPRSK